MNRLQQYIRIARLVLKERYVGLDERERGELEEWLRLSPRNRRDYESQWISAADFEPYGRICPEEAWRRFGRRLKRSRRLHRWRTGGVAASLALLLGLAVVLHLEQGTEGLSGKYPDVTDMAGVRLTLSTGEVVNLSQGREEELQKIEGQAVWHSQKLEYVAGKGQEKEMKWNTLEVPKGTFYHLVLSDSTRVWLNAETRIMYPVEFAARQRRVVVEGEAFFEVSRDAERPFVVQTEAFEVKVLGTSFNINTYGDEGKAYAALLEGVVEVSESAGNALVLAPGQVAEMDVRQPGGLLALSDMELSSQLAWKEGLFCFRCTSLREILKQVGRYYDVTFVNVECVAEEFFTGDISRNLSLGSLLAVIAEQMSDVEFKTVGKEVYVIKRRD